MHGSFTWSYSWNANVKLVKARAAITISKNPLTKILSISYPDRSAIIRALTSLSRRNYFLENLHRHPKWTIAGAAQMNSSLSWNFRNALEISGSRQLSTVWCQRGQFQKEKTGKCNEGLVCDTMLISTISFAQLAIVKQHAIVEDLFRDY